MSKKPTLKDRCNKAWAQDLWYAYYSPQAALRFGASVGLVPDGGGKMREIVFTCQDSQDPQSTIYNWGDTQIVWVGKKGDLKWKGEYSANHKYGNHPAEIHVAGYTTKAGKKVRDHWRHAAHARRKDYPFPSKKEPVKQLESDWRDLKTSAYRN